MKPIHQRMPVILSPEKYNAWLYEGGDILLTPFEGEMLCHPVSNRVNNPANNDSKLITLLDQ